MPLFFTHHTVYQEYVHYVPAPQKATKAVVINFLKWYCRQCDHIIAPTEMTREMILDLYKLPTPVTTLPTGVDLDPYDDADPTWLRASLGIPQEQPVILSLGRLSKEKSPGMLLQAFSIIRERLPEAVFVFAGGGPIREALEQDAQRMGLGSTPTSPGPWMQTKWPRLTWGQTCSCLPPRLKPKDWSPWKPWQGACPSLPLMLAAPTLWWFTARQGS